MLPPINQPSNPLFTAGPNVEMNACVGDNGGPYNWFNYADGFFRGGHAAIKSAQSFDDPVDIMVYPAAFSYRHAIELMLKQMIEYLTWFADEKGPPKKIHSMIALWKDLEVLNAKAGHDLIEPGDFARIGELIGYFNDIDPTGQVFRYPENIKGNRHLTEMALINVEVLMAQMVELQSIFTNWYYCAEEFAQIVVEERHAYGGEE